MADVSKSTRLSQIQALSTGLTKYGPTLSFTVAGTTYTTPAVVQLANGLLASSLAVVQAKVAYEAAVAAENKLLAVDGGVITAVRSNLSYVFSNSPTTLAELQIAQRKTPKPLSTEARAARAAKAKATREARGTTSKKQKAVISGNVTGVNIVPITASSATPAANATPAPVATPSAAAPPVTPASNGIVGATGNVPSHG